MTPGCVMVHGVDRSSQVGDFGILFFKYFQVKKSPNMSQLYSYNLFIIYIYIYAHICTQNI